MGKQAHYQARDPRRGTLSPVMVGGLVVVVVLVAAIAVTVVRAMNQDTGNGGGTLVTPRNATASGALLVGAEAAPVRIEVYLDYMCPFCGTFERANSGEIDRLIADGTARLELHPLAFLDRFSSGTRYSTRAANAIVTVADRAPERLTAFNLALFANQPKEGGEGLPDTRIAEIAQQAGVPRDVTGVLADGIFEPWLTRADDAAFDAGITGTPTIKINGQVYEGDLYTAGPLTQAVTAAAGEQ